MLNGLLAAVWLGLLWYAAPLAGGNPREPADRVAGMLVTGTLIAFVLGFVHALYAPLLFAVALAACAWRYVRRPPNSIAPPARSTALEERLALAIVAFTVVAAAWPALVRPLLEGDSLAYHLPNAASWVQTGSIWQTSTRYWWYPGGSELFAAALAAVSGAFSLGLCGTLAVLLLGLRILAWGKQAGVPPLVCGSVAAATVASATVGLQAGNLLNDVWLGAFFLELLYDARFAPAKLAGDGAVCALVKPYGWVFAAYGVADARRFEGRLLLPIAVFGAWLVRDAVLWPHALIPPGSTAFPQLFSTTIAGNVPHSLSVLFTALVREAPWLIALMAAPFFGLFVLRERRLCVAGIAALVAYALLPFSYRNALQQLDEGGSLRFALPAFAAGAVVATLLLRRAWQAVTVAILLAVTAVELRNIALVFWIDPHTHDALVAAAACACVVLLGATRPRILATAAVGAMLIVAANVTAARDAVARYDELLQPREPGFFRWLAANRPERLVVSDLPAGAVFAVSPQTRAYDVLDPIPCDQARSLRARLAFRRKPPAEKTVFPSAVEQLAHCGEVLYNDTVVRVVQPR